MNVLNIGAQFVLSTAKTTIDIAQTGTIMANEALSLANSGILLAKDRTRRKLDAGNQLNDMLAKKSFKEYYQDTHDNQHDLNKTLDGRLSFEDLMERAMERATTSK